MYVLAQFSEATSFDWLGQLRAKIGKDELKFGDYTHAQLLYGTDKNLWQRVDSGVSEASIFVVDPHTYVTHLIPELLGAGMEFGVDFGWRDLLTQAAERMIADTPAYELTNSRVSMEIGTLVSGHSPLHGMALPRRLPLPRDVLQRIGGRIRDTLRFVARTQAVFEFALVDEAEWDLEDEAQYFRFDIYPTVRRLERVMASTLATHRIFDKEDSRSLEVIAETAYSLSRFSTRTTFETIHLSEEDSKNANALQAADIAAGLARTIIDGQGVRGLLNKFRHVWINGLAASRVVG